MLLYMGCCCTWDVIVHVLHVLYMGCCCTCCMCIVPGMLYMGCCCTRIVHGMLYMLYMYCTRDVAVHAVHVLYMRCYCTCCTCIVHDMSLHMGHQAGLSSQGRAGSPACPVPWWLPGTAMLFPSQQFCMAPAAVPGAGRHSPDKQDCKCSLRTLLHNSQLLHFRWENLKVSC